MADAAFPWGSWLLVSTGTNDLSFMSSFPTLAVSFPWFKAVLVFLLVVAFLAPLLDKGFDIHTDTPQGAAILWPCALLLTITLLWLFGLITGGIVRSLLIWGLYGLAGLFVVALLLNFFVWLQERKSKRSSGINGK